MLLYFLVPQRAKNAVLFASSLAFYFFGEQLFLLLMLGEILLAYLAGRLLAPGPRRGRKAVLVLFLALSLGALGLFKYADLFAETVNAAAGRALIAPLRLALPIGISFYTFQCLSYGIDVFRGAYPPERDFLRFALYVSFFPQLIAGPIVRFDAVRGALETRRHSVAGFGAGAARFALGLGKKVLLA
ncbi:MAG: MBOAT family protein, partial [Oscillospiraceae bacterium]|nr:MBOAT family protein [Oscillospiraceae bacterium]